MLTTARFTIMSLLAFTLLWSVNIFAEDGKGASAMHQMATIMHRLKHYPSPQGKKTLQAIVDDKMTTANERTLAKAMMNLEHHVNPADVDGLKALMASSGATDDEKALAKIILNLNHRPTSEDKKRLEAMMK